MSYGLEVFFSSYCVCNLGIPLWALDPERQIGNKALFGHWRRLHVFNCIPLVVK